MHYRIRILRFMVLWLVFPLALKAQFQNEWIDYNKTYYKFSIGAKGVFRINQQVLANIGLGSTMAEHFQLWRNGEQVPLHTSKASGALSSNDFIEFYGFQNDGKADKALYLNPNFHLDEGRSLFTDTAAYFLTVNNAGPNRRYQTVVNEAATSALTAAPFLWRTTRYNYVIPGTRNPYVNRGLFRDFGEDVYSSAYDEGEMMSSVEVFARNLQGAPIIDSQAIFRNLRPAAVGPDARLRVLLAGAAFNTRTIRVNLGGSQVLSPTIANLNAGYFTNNNISPALLQSPELYVTFQNLSPNGNDRFVIGHVVLDYAGSPDAGNQTAFDFYIPPVNTPTMVAINALDAGGTNPVLYDHANGLRMEAVRDGNTYRFLLPASLQARNCVVTTQQGAKVAAVNSLLRRNFVNFSLAANQGDFLIISNPRLTQVANSAVSQYRDYRNSSAGGGYNARIVDIFELTDQFAFGTKMNPLGIKNFLRFARSRFSQKPKFCLLIGKGVTYDAYRAWESHSKVDELQLVPTYGYPASDNLLASDDLTANTQTPIGRINAISNTEVSIYLDKVKSYEAQQRSVDVTQRNNSWRKQVVHVVGANDAGTERVIRPFMNLYERIAEDTVFGGLVTTFNKFNTTTASTIEGQLLANLFESGFSLMTYFGHSSASALDYNLDDPSQYNNPDKYPVFLLNGCNAGNFYTYDTGRLEQLNTISERYIFARNRGAIALIASTHFGLVSGLGTYSDGFYKSFSGAGFNTSLGRNIQDAIKFTYSTTSTNDFIARIHSEQQTIHGDPSISIYAKARPDYSIEPENISINPSFISVAEQQFTTKFALYNLGKATRDSIMVRVRRTYPASAINPGGLTQVVFERKVRAPLFNDSISLSLPIISERDKGINRLTITLDAENNIPEISEANNEAIKEFAVFENEIRPAYPYNFAIIDSNRVALTATTANPLAEQATYRFELDSTTLFNSPVKRSTDILSRGGSITFRPDLTLQDGSTWFWRVGTVVNGNTPDRWNKSTFKYIANSGTGFGQQGKWQLMETINDRIKLDSATATWQYNPVSNNVFVNHAIFPTSGDEDNDFSVIINGNLIAATFCNGHSLVFNVFDPLTFKPWLNFPGGQFGSGITSCGGNRLRQYNFEWDDRDTANRRKMMAFMDAIPNGYYVMVRKVLDAPYDKESYAPVLKSDEQFFGAGNSLYHRFKAQGFEQIDSFNRPRNFVFFYKKNDKQFEPIVRMSEGLFDRIQVNTFANSTDTLGFVQSPIFGPAKAWKSFVWNGTSNENPANESVDIQLIGLDATGRETVIRSYSIQEKNNNISNVSAAQYPFLKLRMRNSDSLKATPHQLEYWRLLYDPVPEGTLAGNLFIDGKDSVQEGEAIRLGIAFTNISRTSFDSLLVKATLTAPNNSIEQLPVAKLRPLRPGASDTVRIQAASKGKSGINTLYLAVNPDNNQPEQFFFNNFLYKNISVSADNIKPVLDVTFDGQRILNRDIVSAKPHIQMVLKDENGFLALNDTADMEVQLFYPKQSNPVTFRWGTDTLQFTPGNPATGKNEAIIDFMPTLNKDSEDSEYQLVVRGKDRAGNPAGRLSYRVAFRVFTKPMISNLLNYPNPFSTSTAFVFTLTGSDIPQEFKIQILSITGKIVKEITAAELGPLRIGTNITEYKWDGTDMFGQKLANGVYLYRVVTSLNGNALDQFRLNETLDQGGADLTDQFFKKGYGKMVILR